MELNLDLSVLTERASELYDRLNQEIHKDFISFCRHCSENGLLCGVPETTTQQRGELVAIRDLLKEVQLTLVFLQKLVLSQQGALGSAFARLDQSRMQLIERINQHPKHGRKFQVFEELRDCLGHNLQARNKANIRLPEKGQNSHFVYTCIRSILSPRNWCSVARTVIKVIVITASVSSAVHIYTTMTEEKKYGRNKIVASTSNSRLAVLYGRG